MADETIEFKPEITVLPQTDRGELHLVLSGDKKYGFDNLKLTKSFKVTLNHLGWKTQFGLNYNGVAFKYNWIG